MGLLSQTDLQDELAEAMTHHQQGRLAEAERIYRKVLSVHPGDAAVLGNLGAALRGQDRAQEAVDCYRQALEIEPAKTQLHFNLGNALGDLGDWDGAVDCFRRALDIDPGYVEALNNLGNGLSVLDRLEEAADSFSRALKIDPGRADILNNLGNALKDLGKAEQALESFRRAVEIEPSSLRTLNNQGNTFLDLGDIGRATALFERALSLDPDNAESHCLLSMALLAEGDLERGWAENEWRWRLEDYQPRIRHFPFPAWDGSDLDGKSILLWSEQGIGDEICFASMVPDVIAAGARCAIECEPRLVNLFVRSFAHAQVHARPFKKAERGEAAFDFQLPMGNLHRHFRNSLSAFPDRKRFLEVDGERRKFWQDRLSALGIGLKVGVSWRSSKKTSTISAFFASIKDLEPLLANPDTIFINLQYDDCAEEIAEAKDRFGVTLHAWDDIDLMNDIDGAAALTSCLDVVVTPITSVYETSGALGVATHAIHPFRKCAVSFGAAHVPYYPSVRLYRQKIRGDWTHVFEDVAAALRKAS